MPNITLQKIIEEVEGEFKKYVVDCFDRKEQIDGEYILQFISQSITKAVIEVLNKIPINGAIPPVTDYDEGYNQKCREISDKYETRILH
jgi:DNA-binding IscR family transcriptional regulator